MVMVAPLKGLAGSPRCISRKALSLSHTHSLFLSYHLSHTHSHTPSLTHKATLSLGTLTQPVAFHLQTRSYQQNLHSHAQSFSQTLTLALLLAGATHTRITHTHAHAHSHAHAHTRTRTTRPNTKERMPYFGIGSISCLTSEMRNSSRFCNRRKDRRADRNS